MSDKITDRAWASSTPKSRGELVLKWGGSGIEATKRPLGFYWIQASEGGLQVAEWTEYGWALCGSDELFGDRDPDLEILVVAGPLEAPRPDHVPTENPPSSQASEPQR